MWLAALAHAHAHKAFLTVHHHVRIPFGAADGPYELVVVSPRSYFLYTPLLPSAAAGSVQERSIMEPIRNLLRGHGQYYMVGGGSVLHGGLGQQAGYWAQDATPACPQTP